mgnify:CR=1 FL=1
MNRISDLVVERTRPGRRSTELTCLCSALAFPHRLGSTPGCYGDLFCAHGSPMEGHPDYDGRCPICAREEYDDVRFHCWYEEQ